MATKRNVNGPRELSRRELLQWSASIAGVLALPVRYAPRIARAVAAERPTVVWLELADCAGDTESFMRASRPSVDELLFDRVSLEYHETLMCPSGAAAEAMLDDAVTTRQGEYLCVVEGAIPTADGGTACTIAGRSALDIAREVCLQARAVIAVGSCAFDGGAAAAAPNPTGATGVAGALPELTALVNLPGCPANVVNLTATIVHLLTFGELPATDPERRPLFAYGDLIHDRCERRGFHDAGQFALAWGDAGHRNGWCLRTLGCRGPRARHNCPTAKWNDATSWPVGAGHGCIGCSEAAFWDRHAPLYEADWGTAGART